MPTLLDRQVQLLCSIGARYPLCRRALCRRNRFCTPPRHDKEPGLFRCPFDFDEDWRQRVDLADKLAERLKKVLETAASARGLPPPFAPPLVPDHLELSKPIDFRALRDARKNER